MSYNEIGIILGLSAVAIILLVRKKINDPYIKCLWRSALLVFALYTLILLFVEIRWYYITEYAKSFDLNHNGFVDLDEYSENARNAMNRVTKSKIPRNYAPATMAMLSSTVSFAYLLTDLIITRLKIKNSKT